MAHPVAAGSCSDFGLSLRPHPDALRDAVCRVRLQLRPTAWVSTSAPLPCRELRSRGLKWVRALPSVAEAARQSREHSTVLLSHWSLHFPHHTTPHHTTPHHTTPHHTTPHHTTPHHTTPHHTTPHHTTPHHTTHTTPHHTTPHHTTSHHITSHHITSHHITSHHITSHHITSHHITITSHPTPHHTKPHCASMAQSSFLSEEQPARGARKSYHVLWRPVVHSDVALGSLDVGSSHHLTSGGVHRPSSCGVRSTSPTARVASLNQHLLCPRH